MSKDIKIIKHEENEIILQEVSRYKTFYSRYGKYIVLLLILSLLFIGGTVILTLNKTNEYVLDNPGVDIVFPDDDPDIEIDGDEPNTNIPSTDNKPNKPGNNNVVKDPEHLFDDFFGVPDEVCFKVKHISLTDKNIYFYSDYSVKIVYNNGNIVRVLPVDNNYSVDELGNIDNNAKKSSIKIIKKEKTNHGTITYYSDFSAEVEENDLDIWVGKKENIKEYYITENKISYSNDKKEYNNYSITYYHDGTIFINNNSSNEKYFVRNKDDVIIIEYGYLFHYDNAASVISTKKLDNGFTIYYLSDGGAIIEGSDGNVSVRKSNSIVIENNKLIKVQINNEIKEVSRKTVCDKEVIYYNNGTTIIKQDGKVIGYVPESGNIKPSICINENDIIPVVSTSTPNENTTIYIFEDDTVFVDFVDNYNDDGDNNDNTGDNKDDDGKNDIMDDKNNVVIENGVVAIINGDEKEINVSRIKITNNTSNKVKIRVVLENSKNTTLQNYYFKDIKY